MLSLLDRYTQLLHTPSLDECIVLVCILLQVQEPMHETCLDVDYSNYALWNVCHEIPAQLSTGETENKIVYDILNFTDFALSSLSGWNGRRFIET
jgi:hypothetical protein